LQYRSPNAPRKEDILGTLLLAVWAGHKRYAHVTTVRSDSVLPERLGMPCVRSEDSVRRAFPQGEDDQPYTDWTRKHLAASYEPLLSEPWILDMDAARNSERILAHLPDAELGAFLVPCPFAKRPAESRPARSAPTSGRPRLFAMPASAPTPARSGPPVPPTHRTSSRLGWRMSCREEDERLPSWFRSDVQCARLAEAARARWSIMMPYSWQPRTSASEWNSLALST